MSEDIAQQLKNVLLAIGREADIEVDTSTNHVIVQYDELEECVVAVAQSGTTVELRAPLIAFSPDKRDRSFDAALRLNFEGLDGAFVAVSEHAPVLLLRRNVGVENLYQREFTEILIGFIETTRWVRNRLGDACGGQPGAADIPDVDLVILRG